MRAHAPADIDLVAFAADLDALRARVRCELGAEDLAHLRKMEQWGRAATGAGYAAAVFPLNPVSVGLLSFGRLTRWTMIAHHVLHRGYDRVPGAPEHRTAKGFARGKRRLVDWLDWIEPEAWEHEHNRLHHFRLGEPADPDRVDLNLAWLRDAPWPRPVKLAVIAATATAWKPVYYAATVVLEIEARERPKPPNRGRNGYLMQAFRRRRLWTRSILPYAGVQFGLIPVLFLPLGPIAAANVLANSLAAEVLTNLHSFVVVTTNHAGDDLEQFDGRPRGRGEFYLRQVLGSVNFKTGGDLNDALHGFLNYQIEHHLFPDLPMRQYQRIQPEVRAICEKHGVTYRQETVWRRLRKTLAVMTGADAGGARKAPGD